jgi:hypothetical protein
MKIRICFVSNSSSSSFVCDICKEEYSGWDVYPTFTCENDHQVCEYCFEDLDELSLEQKAEVIKQYCSDQIKYYSDKSIATWLTDSERESRIAKYLKMIDGDVEDVFDDHEFNSRHCPVCQLKVYDEEEMCLYLFKKFGVSRDKIFARIKAQNKRRRKLFDHEYISIVCQDFNTTVDQMMEDIRSQFSTWEEYNNFLSSS